jgi:hypothetical protein
LWVHALIDPSLQPLFTQKQVLDQLDLGLGPGQFFLEL